jgi:hypothetical protein
MKRIPLLIAVFLFVIHATYSQIEQQPTQIKFQSDKQERYTLSGIIRDATSGDKLIGATIYIPELKTGVICNKYGFFSITLTAGTYSVQFSFVGYASLEKEVVLTTDIKYDIELIPKITSVDEVIIKGEHNDENLRSTTPGITQLNALELKGIPAPGGMPDVFRSLQLLPGITPVNEGLTQYAVRGGSYDQNLILLDEAPVYNPSHVLGFFSVFNTDAIQSVEMMKGFIPARYGGRLSSVADIRMREGNHHHFKASGNINPLAAGVTVESPLWKGKASFLFSGRYFNFQAMNYILEGIQYVIPVPGLNNFDLKNKINFYDLNFKINVTLNPKDQLFISGYKGSDGFFFAQIDDRSRQDWGNTTATLRWNHIAGDKLFFNTSIIFSRYNYAFSIKDGAENYRWSAFINQANGKIDVDYYPTINNHIETGASLNFVDIMPGKLIPVDSGSLVTNFQMNSRQSLETAFYFSNEQKLGQFAFNYGFRFVPYFSLYKPATDTLYNATDKKNNYVLFEPRFSARYLISAQLSLKIAYNRSSQPIHLLSNSSIGMPTDIWMPADRVIQPQTADHYSAGIYFKLLKGGVEASLEGYYKKMNHIIDFKDDAIIKLNEGIENEVLTGKARAFGIELFLRKSSGRLTGWVGYTLAKTERNIKGINEGKYYPSRFDQRHNISVFMSQTIGKRLIISSTYCYRTGLAVTMPLGTFPFKGGQYTYYSERNGYRLPPSHRLDLSLTLKSREKPKKHWRSEWTASVYNVYDRHNIFSYYFKETSDSGKSELHAIYLPGSIPMITCNFYF